MPTTRTGLQYALSPTFTENDDDRRYPYHNPRCSKSRAAADYLAQQNVETRIVRYLDTPPDISVLREIFGKLGLADVRGMMRVKDDLYRELKLDDPSLDNEALLVAIAAHPALLERPDCPSWAAKPPSARPDGKYCGFAGGRIGRLKKRIQERNRICIARFRHTARCGLTCGAASKSASSS